MRATAASGEVELEEGEMKLLCATDLLPKSESAIIRACMLAEQLEVGLSLLHVVKPGTDERARELEVRRMVERLQSRTQPPLWRRRAAQKVLVRTGSPPELIIDTANRLRARLTILGPHRKRGVRNALKGTTAEKLLRALDRPVLIVRKEPAGPYRDALFASDLSEMSADAMRAAETLVLRDDARSVVLHALTPGNEGSYEYTGVSEDSTPAPPKSSKQEPRKSLRELLRRQRAGASREGVIVADGPPPASAILRASEMMQPDLLVMGTRGDKGEKALLGSVANRVLHEATCDVLIVPEGSFRRLSPRAGTSLHARASDVAISQMPDA